jgi:two-component system, cell cycle sensor histidine kinase and response regulator CckA
LVPRSFVVPPSVSLGPDRYPFTMIAARSSLRALAPYAMAVLAVGVATLIRLLAGPWLADDPSVMFLAAVSLVAWQTGLGPGILTVVLSAVSQGLYFIAPETLFVATWAQGTSLFAWSLEGVLVCLIFEALRKRTLQLQCVNETLVLEVSGRAKLENQLRHTQKMEAIGCLAGGIAHDFNNMLTIILGYTGLAAAELDEDSPARDMLAEVKRAGERSSDLTRQLLAFSRQEEFQTTAVEVGAAIDETLQMVARIVGETIEVVSARDPGRYGVRLGAGQLEQVLMNLVLNARDAMPEGGRLKLEARRVAFDSASPHARLPPGAYLKITVEDSGEGMRESTRERIFEPFFTTREQGKGTGLGLSTVFGIVQHAGGLIDVESAVGRGSTFTVYFPEVAVSDSPSSASPITLPPREDAGTVLLAEDEALVRQLITRFLRGAGYEVLAARDAAEAIELLSRHEGRVDLLLTDVVMPGMNGRLLAKRVIDIRPETKVLFMSGYTDGAKLAELGPAAAFLQKPVTETDLLAKLDHVLGRRRMTCIDAQGAA